MVALESECTKQICPEMKADGWLYLCAAHPSTQSVSGATGKENTLSSKILVSNKKVSSY